MEGHAFTGTVTDTESWLFRDSLCLEEVVSLPIFSSGKSVEIASIGCSSGEEVYSLMAMLQVAERPFCIKGYDISQPHLKKAREGLYRNKLGVETTRATASPNLRRYYQQFDEEDDSSLFLVDKNGLRGFERRDIVMAPLTAPVDVILCRNVLFHYNGRDNEMRCALNNIDASLRYGGVLVLDTRSAELLNSTGYLQMLYDRGYTLIGGNPKLLMKQEIARA
jgi:chemotaxis methyl-accepting protein methylase